MPRPAQQAAGRGASDARKVGRVQSSKRTVRANATVYQSIITNYSSNPSRRATFTVGIAYDSSAAKAQDLIAAVLKEHPAVFDTPESSVLVDELGAATVNLRIYYWFDSATHSPARINSALLRLTNNVLVKNGIELPDPAREVIFPKPVPEVIFPKPVPIELFRVSEAAPEPPLRDEPPRAKETEETGVSATVGEADLANETTQVSEQAQSPVPEAKENFLKKSS